MKEETTITTRKNNIGIIELIIPDYLKDAGITDIHSDKDIQKLDIAVTTEKGVVTLKGGVDNKDEKEKAIRLAEEVEGVFKVKDELIVEEN